MITNLKKIIIAVLMATSMPVAFGHCPLSLKEELEDIDNFAKELRQAGNQSQELVKYLEEILKNGADSFHYSYHNKHRYVSDDEVLAVVRILKADVTFEEKQSAVTKIMIETYEAAAKIKAERNRQYWLDKALAVGGFSILLLFVRFGVYLDQQNLKK